MKTKTKDLYISRYQLDEIFYFGYKLNGILKDIEKIALNEVENRNFEENFKQCTFELALINKSIAIDIILKLMALGEKIEKQTNEK